jgi:hypothetical protein
MDFFADVFNWLARLSAKMPAIDFSTYFFVVLGALAALALVIGLTYFGTPAFKLMRASRKISSYLSGADAVDDDNVDDFSSVCFSLKSPAALREAWTQYLGVRFGYPSDVISDSAVLNKELKSVKNVRANLFLGIALIILAFFAFWGFGTLPSAQMSVIHLCGLLLTGVLYIVLVYSGKGQDKRARELFERMQEDLDVKVSLQVEKNYATDVSPLNKLSAMVNEIIARNTAKAVDLSENLIRAESAEEEQEDSQMKLEELLEQVEGKTKAEPQEELYAESNDAALPVAEISEDENAEDAEAVKAENAAEEKDAATAKEKDETSVENDVNIQSSNVPAGVDASLNEAGIAERAKPQSSQDVRAEENALTDEPEGEQPYQGGQDAEGEEEAQDVISNAEISEPEADEEAEEVSQPEPTAEALDETLFADLAKDAGSIADVGENPTDEINEANEADAAEISEASEEPTQEYVSSADGEDGEEAALAENAEKDKLNSEKNASGLDNTVSENGEAREALNEYTRSDAAENVPNAEQFAQEAAASSDETEYNIAEESAEDAARDEITAEPEITESENQTEYFFEAENSENEVQTTDGGTDEVEEQSKDRQSVEKDGDISENEINAEEIDILKAEAESEDAENVLQTEEDDAENTETAEEALNETTKEAFDKASKADGKIKASQEELESPSSEADFNAEEEAFAKEADGEEPNAEAAVQTTEADGKNVEATEADGAGEAVPAEDGGFFEKLKASVQEQGERKVETLETNDTAPSQSAEADASLGQGDDGETENTTTDEGEADMFGKNKKDGQEAVAGNVNDLYVEAEILDDADAENALDDVTVGSYKTEAQGEPLRSSNAQNGAEQAEEAAENAETSVEEPEEKSEAQNKELAAEERETEDAADVLAQGGENASADEIGEEASTTDVSAESEQTNAENDADANGGNSVADGEESETEENTAETDAADIGGGYNEVAASSEEEAAEVNQSDGADGEEEASDGESDYQDPDFGSEIVQELDEYGCPILPQKPSKLLKLSQLTDYMLSLNPSKNMKIKLAMLMIQTYKVFEKKPQDKAVIIECMKKIMASLIKG